VYALFHDYCIVEDTVDAECIGCPVALFCVTGTRIVIGGCHVCKKATRMGFPWVFQRDIGDIAEYDSEFVRWALLCASAPASVISPTPGGYGALCPECAEECLDEQKKQLEHHRKNHSR
jgi:hypothetical protein